MNVLVEVHDEIELDRAIALSPKIIGVNSRNLKTLEVDMTSFARLLPQVPEYIIKVAESGISDISDIKSARAVGADAVLVGEALVKSADPGATVKNFLESVNQR
jgi:indole-3-glycerol phosphate synthase